MKRTAVTFSKQWIPFEEERRRNGWSQLLESRKLAPVLRLTLLALRALTADVKDAVYVLPQWKDRLDDSRRLVPAVKDVGICRHVVAIEETIKLGVEVREAAQNG